MSLLDTLLPPSNSESVPTAPVAPSSSSPPPATQPDREQPDAHARRDRPSDHDHRDLAAQALTLLRRLKTFAVPVNQMGAAREMVERVAASSVSDDPAAMLGALCEIEQELMALGAAPDPELAAAVEVVTTTFPGAQLIEIRNKGRN